MAGKKNSVSGLTRDALLNYLSTINRNLLAYMICEADNTVDNYYQRGAPRNKDGSYNFREFMMWWKENKLNEYDMVRTQKMRADAMLSELKLATKTGILVEKESILRAVEEHITTASKMIRDLDKKLARHVPEAQRSDFMAEARIEIDEILFNLSDTGVVEVASKEKEIEPEAEADTETEAGTDIRKA